MRVLDLFTGIGGHAIALKDYATPVAYCDNNPFTHRVLEARMQEGKLHRAPIFDNVETLKASDLSHAPELITASFPCQDISTAGNRAGIEAGTRSGLVWQVFRIIDELGTSSPLRAVYLENSPALRVRGLDKIVAALEERDFTVIWGNLLASDVGARHRRTRIWILAVRGRNWKSKLPVIPIDAHGHNFKRLDDELPRLVPSPEERSVKSIAVKRWSALGNAVVPQVSHAAFAIMLDLLRKGVKGEQNKLSDVYPHYRDPSELYDDMLSIKYGPDETAHRYNLWLTPVFSKSHFIPTNPKVMRNRGTFATRVYLERGTHRVFGEMDPDKDGMREARNRYMMNIGWVEALMGFPQGWTNVQ